MSMEQIKSVLLNSKHLLSVEDAIKKVPDSSGYYSIWIKESDSFPKPFSTELKARKSNLIYIGITSKSLKERLVEQELQHKNPATFFRSLGAILGFRPPKGSLAKSARKNNYRFSKADTEEIKEWVRGNLKVQFFPLIPFTKDFKKSLIVESTPLLNSTHNPKRSQELSALRQECRRIAS